MILILSTFSVLTDKVIFYLLPSRTNVNKIKNSKMFTGKYLQKKGMKSRIVIVLYVHTSLIETNIPTAIFANTNNLRRFRTCLSHVSNFR